MIKIFFFVKDVLARFFATIRFSVKKIGIVTLNLKMEKGWKNNVDPRKVSKFDRTIATFYYFLVSKSHDAIKFQEIFP